MKLTKQKLRKIIKEETMKLNEGKEQTIETKIINNLINSLDLINTKISRGQGLYLADLRFIMSQIKKLQKTAK